MVRESAGRFVRFIMLAVMLVTLGGCVTYPVGSETALPVVRSPLFRYPYFSDQVTGIAISSQGRMFANFPRWGNDHRYSVAEILEDGSLRPYPDTGWNRWEEADSAHPEAHFICVQSVYADDDRLWVLDPASPSFGGVVAGGAKLVEIDLETDRVVRVIRFGPAAAPPRSYLNDVRIDPAVEFAYITDSGLGAILVVNLGTGTVRRLLEDHSSTKAEPGYVPVIGGKELRDGEGRVPQVHADGIAIDPDGTYLYYHALTARTLYRIRTSVLTDPSLSAAAVAGRVERVADTGAADGMEMDGDGNLYITAPEENAVKRWSPEGRIATIVRDARIQWPDSIAISDDDYLYVTDSQINLMPRFNGGKDLRRPPYELFRIWLEPL